MHAKGVCVSVCVRPKNIVNYTRKLERNCAKLCVLWPHCRITIPWALHHQRQGQKEYAVLPPYGINCLLLIEYRVWYDSVSVSQLWRSTSSTETHTHTHTHLAICVCVCKLFFSQHNPHPKVMRGGTRVFLCVCVFVVYNYSCIHIWVLYISAIYLYICLILLFGLILSYC